jgi:hypothetical protein
MNASGARSEGAMRDWSGFMSEGLLTMRNSTT